MRDYQELGRLPGFYVLSLMQTVDIYSALPGEVPFTSWVACAYYIVLTQLLASINLDQVSLGYFKRAKLAQRPRTLVIAGDR